MNYEPEMHLKILVEELEELVRYQEANKYSLAKDKAAHVAVHLRMISLWMEVKHLSEFLGTNPIECQDPGAARWRYEGFSPPWGSNNCLSP